VKVSNKLETRVPTGLFWNSEAKMKALRGAHYEILMVKHSVFTLFLE